MKKLIFLILTLLYAGLTFAQLDGSTNEEYMYWSGFLGSVFTGSPSITVGQNGGNSGQINFIASDNDQWNLAINTSDQMKVNDAAAFLFLNNGANPYFQFGDNASNNVTIQWASASDYGQINANTNAPLALQSTSSGNVGVGTITPNNKFNVDGAFNFASDTSTANQLNIFDLVISGFDDYGATGIVAGAQVSWIAGHENTGAANILVNAFAQKDLYKMGDQELASGDIEAGQIVTAIYDGTQWQMTSQLAQ